jgi:diguanylate cyclase (GGDEF)-like protein
VVFIVAAAVVLLACALAIRLALRHREARRAAPHVAAEECFPGAVLVFDRRLRHTLAYGRDLPAVGDDPLGKTLRETVPPELSAVFEPAYRAALEGSETHIELPFADRDWLVTVSPLAGEAGIVVVMDVTDRKRRERRLTELASRDTLTGAWNRRRLEEELDWLVRSERSGALLVLDLDGFKQVNDRLGHDAGDELLRRVAHALSGCVRRADVVARLGGDEFAVLLAGATPDEAARVADKIRAAVAAVWPMGIRGGVSIGIASAGNGASEAMGRADRAMYAAKRAEPLRRVS